MLAEPFVKLLPGLSVTWASDHSWWGHWVAVGHVGKMSWVRLYGRWLQGGSPVTVLTVQRMYRHLHCSWLLTIWPICKDVTESPPVVPLPGHPEQAVDGEPELAHPPEHLAVQVHVRDETPAKGEEGHSELCAGSSHDEKVDRGKVGSRNTDALGHESSIWLGGLALPVDKTPH